VSGWLLGECEIEVRSPSDENRPIPLYELCHEKGRVVGTVLSRYVQSESPTWSMCKANAASSIVSTKEGGSGTVLSTYVQSEPQTR
jgi:hypothetical protein